MMKVCLGPLLTLVLCLNLASNGAAQEKKKSAAKASPAKSQALFDGKTLNGWTPSDFATQSSVTVENPFKNGPAAIVIDQGDALSGITFTNRVPKTNYELSLEAMKLNGSDFFCGLTFPVNDTHCSFILGGWGGAVVGISSIDGSDASENETTKFMKFDNDKWYRVRVRVTPAKVQAWVDDEQLVDLELEGKRIEMRPGEIENARPLGISTYQTRAALRNLRLTELPK